MAWSLLSQQESRWVHIQNTAAKKTLLLGTIKMATLNLFMSACGKDREHNEVSPEDTLQQLSKVGQWSTTVTTDTTRVPLPQLTKNGH